MRLAPRAESRFLLLAGLCAAFALLAPRPVDGEPPDVRVASDVGGLEASSAALVLSGQQGGDLAASLAIFPFPSTTPGITRLALVVDLAAAALLAPRAEQGTAEPAGDENPEDPLILEVHAYALGPGDALTAYFTQAFTVARSELAPDTDRATDRAGVKFLGALDVPPGDWSVRLLVRERQSGRLALRARRVEAPDFATGTEPLLMLPLFTDPVDRWVLARQAGDPGTLPFPLDLSARGGGSGWLVPSTRPVVEPGGRAFYLLRRGPEPPTAEWTARLSESGADPTDRGGSEPVPLRRRRLGAFAPEGEPGSGLILWEVELDPGPLPSGSGVLTIAEGAVAETSLPTVVLPPGVELAGVSDRVLGGLVLWTDLAGAAVARSQPIPTPSAPATTKEVRITDAELARFQAAYLGAVQQLADGRWAAALTTVEELEQSRMSGGAAADLLARGQLQVAWDVSGGVVDRMLPLIQLHGDLYREYRLAGHPSLAAHARRITQGLIELYVKHGGDEDRGEVAASALVGLAGQLLAYGNSLETFGLLELALEHDPDHSAALLLLASLHELLGNYRDAVGLLRRLEETTPGDDPVGAEGRLRLGINLLRVGSGKQAVERLQDCLAPNRPGWVRAVAYEELAALHAQAGRLAEARSLLERAVEQMPHQQRLYIQLAAVYESLGQPAKARAVLDELETRARQGSGRDRDSPRLRYSQWSEEALASSRERFERAAAARMTALAEALAQFMAQGG